MIAFIATAVHLTTLDEAGILKPFNIVISLAIMAALGWRAFTLVREDAAYIFTPALWFRAATLVYFGFGNIVPYIVGWEVEAYLRYVFDFTDHELLKLNLIILVGILSVLSLEVAFARSFQSMFERMPSLRPPARGQGLWSTCLALLILGGLFRYLVILPQLVGAQTAIVPGVFGYLGYLFYAGLFLLLLYSLRTGGRKAALSISLVAFEIVICLCSFAKTHLLLTSMIVWLAFLHDRMSLRRLVIGSISLVLVYISMIPLVDYGRVQMLTIYGSLNGANLGTRLGFVTDFFTNPAPAAAVDTAPRMDRTLNRLSYANVSTYLINAYDGGVPGETYGAAVTVLVPRIIWRDKPNISNQGIELTQLIYGFDTSSTGSGVFSEAYWNYGWMGLMLGMAFYGILISFLTQLSLVVMRREIWIFVPVVFAGVQFGTRVDGRMSVDVVGSFGIIIVLFLSLIAASRLTSDSSRRAVMPGTPDLSR
ncbi:hypothetical protein [Rhizorhabdus dicambivorans]|uniref:hypothetical protein n=1 Tax=Rhizorhabdus dicambivorans TaxID=1850238 RepID=UPI001111E810|nr:hypothetical protein [Rhizorhabdus dicambivorans]